MLVAVLQQLTVDSQLTNTGLGVLAELLQTWAADDAPGMIASLESSPAAYARLQQLCVLQAQQQQSSLSQAPSVAAAVMEACLAAAASQPAELVKAFHAVDVWLHLLPGPTQYAAVKQLLEQHMDLTVKLVKHELEGSEAQRLQRRVAVTMLDMLGDTAAMPARATSSALASLGSWALWRQISVASLSSAPVIVADLLRTALLPVLHIFVAQPGLCKEPRMTALLRQALLELETTLTRGKALVMRWPSNERHQALRLMVLIAALLMTAHKAKLWRAGRNKVLPAELKELQQAASMFKVPAAALEQLRGVLGGAGCSREPGAQDPVQMAGIQPERRPVSQPGAQYPTVTSAPVTAAAGAAVEAAAVVAQPGERGSKDVEVPAGVVVSAAGADPQPQATSSPGEQAEPMEMDLQLAPTTASHFQPAPRKSDLELAKAAAGAAGAYQQPQAILPPEDQAEPMEVEQHPTPTAASQYKPSPGMSYRDATMRQLIHYPQQVSKECLTASLGRHPSHSRWNLLLIQRYICRDSA